MGRWVGGYYSTDVKGDEGRVRKIDLEIRSCSNDIGDIIYDEQRLEGM